QTCRSVKYLKCIFVDKDIYCPKGWSCFGKQCLIFINSPKSWPKAGGYCLFEGANLASIHSYTENHFIQDLTGGNTHDFPETWISGHNAICVWKSLELI
ncbi:hypothetical protein L3Q82_016481, partial [Scortum barcoo]